MANLHAEHGRDKPKKITSCRDFRVAAPAASAAAAAAAAFVVVDVAVAVVGGGVFVSSFEIRSSFWRTPAAVVRSCRYRRPFFGAPT